MSKKAVETKPAIPQRRSRGTWALPERRVRSGYPGAQHGTTTGAAERVTEEVRRVWREAQLQGR